jgi:hypothetical protein
MSQRVYQLPSIGEIIVTKHPSSRRMTIKLRHGALPKVVIPKLMPYETGYRFAVEKKQWIAEHLEKLANKPLSINYFNENDIFSTRYHKIHFKTHLGKNVISQKFENDIYLKFPVDADFNSPAVQQLIRKYISNVLKQEAKIYLPKRVDFLAARHGFRYNKVAVKDVKSRWGSCSGKNNINLNIHLMRLPEHLSDFIILHELCHTIHKNHGEKFHQLMEQLTVNEKAFEKELKNYKIEF